MPFHIIRNDITKVKADAIVNTCNPKPIYASGTDGAIYRAAGVEELLAERKKIGNIEPGNIGVTPAFALPAKYIIHASGPVWKGGDHGEFEILQACYQKSLEKAVELECESIAFPLMATGVYGFPKQQALQIALSTITNFVMEHEITVYLVIFSAESYKLSLSIFPKVDAFISSHEVAEKFREEYSLTGEELQNLTDEEIELYHTRRRNIRQRLVTSQALADQNETFDRAARSSLISLSPGWKSDTPEKQSSKSIDDILTASEKSFNDKLFEYISRSGLENKEIYTAANMDRKLFSKILSKKDSKPKKKNVLCLAIGLKLNMEETTDLLARADCAFNPYDKLDLVVQYYIENKEYDISSINWYLFSHNLETLGDYGDDGI